MVTFSKDVDILKYEPALFGSLHLPWQVTAAGTGAVLSGTTLTAAGADFISAHIAPGNVVYLNAEDAALDGAYEIVSVDAATQLTVSVLRAAATDTPVAPPAASDIAYWISTFDPQAAEVAFQLTESFGIQPGHPASAITVDHIVDAAVLRRASALAVISSVYAMWASRDGQESFWTKSLHYRRLFEDARRRSHLSIDLGADGIADATRVGDAIALVRD